ncbi:probable serine/threonine-protein kinase PIX13 [Rhododendron vialii]|uniref:probable serine/threonine-protein kinase PIX13 n=1 Tax=Rhododendron vialii TaxID=182163 RepID=UPI00265D691E|nr:probable serine/threonine-protein kinase PIX13 [Rhododendron vialii]
MKKEGKNDKKKRGVLHSQGLSNFCKDCNPYHLFNSKISDFGYADLDYPESFWSCGYVPTPLETSGYIAPEYFATGHLSVKGNVYNFGVVLLEMLTGLRAHDMKRLPGQHNLVDWVKPYLANGRKLTSVMDSRLEGEYPPKAALRLAHLAQQCLEEYPN